MSVKCRSLRKTLKIIKDALEVRRMQKLLSETMLPNRRSIPPTLAPDMSWSNAGLDRAGSDPLIFTTCTTFWAAAFLPEMSESSPMRFGPATSPSEKMTESTSTDTLLALPKSAIVSASFGSCTRLKYSVVKYCSIPFSGSHSLGPTNSRECGWTTGRAYLSRKLSAVNLMVLVLPGS